MAAANRLAVISHHVQATPRLENTSAGRWRYTMSNSSPKQLNPEQRDFYEKNGYLVVKGLVSQEDIDNYRIAFQDLCEGRVSNSAAMTMMKDVAIAKSEFAKGEKAITKIQDFAYHEPLFHYCYRPQILDYAQNFTGPNIMAMHTMLINKPPDPGTQTSRHPLHQDLHYFPFRPVDQIVCSWTAMERVNRANGCLIVYPGTHHTVGRLLEHGYPDWKMGVNKMYYGIVDFDRDAYPSVHLEMESGDTVFFHPLLVHGSGANKTQGFRKAISCHYAASECDYIESPENLLVQEAVGVAQARLGPDVTVSYKDLWQMKSRLVRGERIKL